MSWGFGEDPPDPPDINWKPESILVYDSKKDMFAFYEDRKDSRSMIWMSPEVEDFEDRKKVPYEELAEMHDWANAIKKRDYYNVSTKQTLLDEFVKKKPVINRMFNKVKMLITKERFILFGYKLRKILNWLRGKPRCCNCGTDLSKQLLTAHLSFGVLCEWCYASYPFGE